jgi:hypothetical protein
MTQILGSPDYRSRATAALEVLAEWTLKAAKAVTP